MVSVYEHERRFGRILRMVFMSMKEYLDSMLLCLGGIRRISVPDQRRRLKLGDLGKHQIENGFTVVGIVDNAERSVVIGP